MEYPTLEAREAPRVPVEAPTSHVQAPVLDAYRAGPQRLPNGDKPSAFNAFFVLEDGVISLSLRWMTTVASALVAGVIVGSTFVCWYLDFITIDATHWPFISDISGLPLFSRMYCLVFMLYALGVQQTNVRAHYAFLAPHVSPLYNAAVLITGFAAVLILPLIYYWDEYWSLETHDTLALSFFALQTVFIWLSSSAFSRNAAKFPAGDQAAIQRLSTISYLLVIALGVFVFVNVSYPEDVFHQAIIEWITVALMMFWVVYVSFESPYYDSVHVYGKVVKRTLPTFEQQAANQL
eukprot:NODE_2363_length_937_cov_44.546171_g1943_i0.p1 GENE.NODE_2363_length_937_cov_44.546171_g1943_i0~~NODE_2363_length_937_cov_44.546171_g1943_i0.p1  ORF type:complete len:303 (+),score=70.43 NODE_2363_length_937_cov_44.546171_g1943_i0:32-910(+)